MDINSEKTNESKIKFYLNPMDSREEEIIANPEDSFQSILDIYNKYKSACQEYNKALYDATLVDLTNVSRTNNYYSNNFRKQSNSNTSNYLIQ